MDTARPALYHCENLEGYRLWAEPDVGKLFGGSYERAREGQIHFWVPLDRPS